MSDYETVQKNRNITVGVFVLLGFCALVYLIFKFGDLPTSIAGIRSFSVFVRFPMATGVQRDTPVRFCGYQIGRVTEVQPPKVLKELNTNRFYHQTVVELSIEKKYNDIPEDVQVKLMTRGLGSSYIELKLKSFDVTEPTGPFLIEGSLLQGSSGMTSEFFPEESQKKLEQLVDSIRALVTNTNMIIGDPNNRENIKVALANLSIASKDAGRSLKAFGEFSAAGAVTFKNSDARLEEIAAAAVATSEQLSETMEQLELVLEKINSGEGTAAKLINDGRFYENLLENTEQMHRLLENWVTFSDEVSTKGRLPIKLK